MLPIKKDFEKAIELKNEGLTLRASWYRQILTLASGGLALLVALQPNVPPEGIGKYFLAAAWVFLGMGILFGAGATYSEVHNSRSLAAEYIKKLQKCVQERQPYMDDMPIFAKPKLFFTTCRFLMLTTLLLSVVCLVTFSTIKTLTPSIPTTAKPTQTKTQSTVSKPLTTQVLHDKPKQK